MKEAKTVSEMLDRLIAQDFTKFVSRWQFKAYIYALPFGNKHWMSVFFLIRAICIKVQLNLFTVNILSSYIFLQSKYEEEGWWGSKIHFNHFCDTIL